MDGQKWNQAHRLSELLPTDGQPYWTIMRWMAPEKYGRPGLFYLNTWEDFTRLYFLAEYPWEGRYEPVIPLRREEMVNGKLVIEHFPLQHVLIDKLIPLLIQYELISDAERKAIAEEAAAREAKAENDLATEQTMESLPTYYGPVSYSRQGCRTALIDKKIEQLQRAWTYIAKTGKVPKLQKGFFQGSRPRVSVN